ncbi:MAG: DUF1593 domain-containing protein [Planctomycetota bacterium]|nr:DUF1593 domain-containing protein [Planctomycetota bacterium]
MLVFILSLGISGNVRADDRLRVIIETDAGGDPDDEQSLVRFLLYSNEWDVEGIIANRPKARDKENLNPQRTGLGIVQAQLNAYGECYPNLRQHDRRYPTLGYLEQHTVAGYEDVVDGVTLVIAAVDKPDPRPVWFCNWGTDNGAASSCLKRALDQILRERGQGGYTKFKSRLRLSSYDKFGEHTDKLEPPFPIWIDTFRPEIGGKRWYHQFSAITATAGGFDVRRDVLKDHGPLGALYPTNTTHPQKEGDTMAFLYLVPTGMNDPEHPNWGSWAGRYGQNETCPGRPYYWANQQDTWQGSASRENTLRRWSADLQNDFRARLDWCVKDLAHANHPPQPRVKGDTMRTISAGQLVELDASDSMDPDGNSLRFHWLIYGEAGGYKGAMPQIQNADSAKASLVAPAVASEQTIHVLLIVSDDGSPSLCRYQRAILRIMPAVRP